MWESDTLVRVGAEDNTGPSKPGEAPAAAVTTVLSQKPFHVQKEAGGLGPQGSERQNRGFPLREGRHVRVWDVE